MNFQNYSSIAEVLIAANFSYSFSLIRNPINESFKKLAPEAKSLKRCLLKIARLESRKISSSLSIDQEIQSNPLNKRNSLIQIDRFLDIDNKKLTRINKNTQYFISKSKLIEKEEAKCHLFNRNLPPLYLMAALFGVFVLLCGTFQENYFTKDDKIPKNVFNSIVFLSELISVFYFYVVISTFNIKIFKVPKTIYTLGLFISFVSLFILIDNSIIQHIVLEVSDSTLSIWIIVLFCFSFLFHLIRQFQIRITYQVTLFFIFIYTLFIIYLVRLLALVEKKIVVVILVLYRKIVNFLSVRNN